MRCIIQFFDALQESPPDDGEGQVTLMGNACKQPHLHQDIQPQYEINNILEEVQISKHNQLKSKTCALFTPSDLTRGYNKVKLMGEDMDGHRDDNCLELEQRRTVQSRATSSPCIFFL